MDEEFLDEALSGTISREVLSWMVALLKIRKFESMTAAAAMKSLERDFLKYPKKRRAYEMLTVAQLKPKAEALGIKVSNMKKSQLIDAILEPGSETQQQTKKKRGPRVKPLDSLEPAIVPLVVLLKQSYLLPQTSALQSAAAIGHRNEEPFLKAFFHECKKANTTPYSFGKLNPVAIFRVGLMRKRGSKFAKASLDGVTFVKNDDDSLELIPTEVKSRVSPSTLSEARDRIEDIVGAELYNTKSKYLLEVPSSSPLFRGLIHDDSNKKREKQEAFQLLHGVHVSGAKRGLLLVGSKDALMYGILVSFEEELLEAYSAVINNVYDNHVKIFYESTVNELQEDDKLQSALDAFDYLDEHCFWSTHMLWRALNVDVVTANVWFPLPPCARCIPFQNAHWNVVKGPSDTTTKLIDGSEEHLGVRTPRTVATARHLLIGSIAYHRSLQVLSANTPESHASLHDFRHANNCRYSMSDSLTVLIQHLRDDHSRLQPSQPPMATLATIVERQTSRITPYNTPPRPRTRGEDEAPQRVHWSYLEKHGVTPRRGRPAGISHKLRERRCDGRVLMAVVADPEKADAGDPRQNQGLTTKRIDKILTDDDEGLRTERPKPLIRMREYDPKKEAWESIVAKNCCYLLQHKDAFDEVWRLKKNSTLDDFGNEVEDEEAATTA